MFKDPQGNAVFGSMPTRSLQLLTTVSLLLCGLWPGCISTGKHTATSPHPVSSTQAALTAPARNDLSTPLRNAVVRVGGGCTGTLIDDRTVLTAAHCLRAHGADDIAWTTNAAHWERIPLPPPTRNPNTVFGLRGQPAQPGRDVVGWDIDHAALNSSDPSSCAQRCDQNRRCQGWTYQRPSRPGAAAHCWLKRGGVAIHLGPDPDAFTSTFFGSYYSMPGKEDIAMLRLDQAVPTSLAQPARVLSEVSAFQSSDSWLAQHRFLLVGWGGGHAHRRTMPARFGASRLRGNPNMIYVRGDQDVKLEPGDSGSPAFMLAPVGRAGRGTERYLTGAAQGVEQAGGRFVPSFTHGGLSDTGVQRNDLSRWLDSTLYSNAYRKAAHIPLYHWWSGRRTDNYLTSDPRWSAFPRGLVFSGHNIVNQHKRGGYRMSRLEGMVFSPKRPQPAGTVPLYSWWNPERTDNFTTTDPRWSMDPSHIRWVGEHLHNGSRRSGYTMYRLEGYIYDPHRPQPPGTRALYSWWNPRRKDNFTTTDPRWSMDPSQVRWSGEHLSNGRNQDGYTLYRLEGYVLDADSAVH